ncbi:unnamed protein product [Fusarium graminearum]|nr:unnamed protein product [Fusarium graminearum]
MTNALKEVALAIFNMFDYGAAYLIEGVEIDCPGNALMLTLKLYLDFGDFDVFFKPVGIVLYWSYVRTFLPPGFSDDIPIT